MAIESTIPLIGTHEQTFWATYARVYEQVLTQFSAHRKLMLDIRRSQQAVIDLLDVGCGPGLLASQLARQDRRVVGIDYSEPMIKIARSRIRPGLEFNVMDAAQLSYPDDTFSGVVSTNLLYFVPDPRQVLREMSRVLRSGGLLTLSAPRTGADTRVLSRQLMREVEGRPELQKDLELFFQCNAMLDRHGLRNLFSLAGIRDLVLEAGFSRVIELRPSYLRQNYFITAIK